MSSLPRQDLEHIFSYTDSLWENLRGHSLFLTGGTGFVGSWLLESLLWVGDKLDLGVRVVVLTRDPQGFVGKATHLAGHPSVHLLRGDARDFDFPEGKFPYVIHAATEPYRGPDAKSPLGAFDADIEGTRRVLEFARTHGVRRFLFTSSGAIYGKQPAEMSHIPEEFAGAPSTVDTGSAYGQAKRVSEFMCAMYGRAYGFDAVVARLFAFVGPRLPLDANYAVGNFIRDAIKGGPVHIGGDGTPCRSYLYAADMTIWLWRILFLGKSAHPYNVGSCMEITIKNLARVVADVLGPDLAIEIAQQPLPAQNVARYVPSTERADKELGLRSWVTLEQGILRTVDWTKRTPSK